MRSVAVGLMCAVMAAGGLRAFAQEDVVGNEKGNPRDAAEVKEALDGWWTASQKTVDERLAWWREARFGCFMHWGVYSELGGIYNGKKGGGYAEHIMRVLKIPREEYKDKVAATFNPDKFNADEWVKLVKGAGMRYLVITAKHHDGFAMYPSDVTPYNIRDTSHFARDPMKELSEACKKAGIKFGFYYSHAFDWEHPDAPGNDWDYQNPGGDKKLLGGTDWYNLHPDILARVSKNYVDGKAIPQLQELVAKYHPDIFWFDTSGKLPLSEQLRVVKAVRAADANVVINGRAARGMGHNFGDYADTADRPAEVRDPGGDWEAIPSVNDSYGYSSYDKGYRTPEFFVQLIAKTAAKGGNTLLNIGPKGDGTIDENATRILTGIGKWMDVYGESIHGTTRTPLDRQAWGDSTVKGNVVYLHVFHWPSDGKLVVGGLLGEVKSVELIPDTPALQPRVFAARLNDKDVGVSVEHNAPNATDSVIKLTMDGEVKGEKGRLLATNVGDNTLLAFDATPHGRFQYGDGKAGRYYATNFSADKSLSWNVRVNQPTSFDVSVVYSAAEAGKLSLKAGETTLSGDAEVSKEMKTLKLGRLDLTDGAPVDISLGGEGGVSVFNLVLTPVAPAATDTQAAPTTQLLLH